MRLVLANCTDRAREAAFNEWYDDYASSLTEAGFFVDAARYKGDSERAAYVSLYTIAMDDPGAAWPSTYAWWEERGGHALSPLLDVPYRATYARISGSGTAYPRIAVRLLDVEDDAEAWYRAAPDVEGAAVTAYTLVEGSPDPPQLLEIVGTNGRSAQAAFDAVRAARGEAPSARERFLGFYDRVFSYVPSSAGARA